MSALSTGLAVEPEVDLGDPARPPRGCASTLLGVACAIDGAAIDGDPHLQRTSRCAARVRAFLPRSAGRPCCRRMPYKRNSVATTENLTGLARIVRACVTPALENVALLARAGYLALLGRAHDHTGFQPQTLDFALARLAGVVDKLVSLSGEYAGRILDRLGGPDPLQRVLIVPT